MGLSPGVALANILAGIADIVKRILNFKLVERIVHEGSVTKHSLK